MSYQTYLTAPQPLTEKTLEIEWLSIQEALDKKMTLPEFFQASQLSTAELNEPGVVAFMKDGFGVAISLNEDVALRQTLNSDYVYDVQLVADDALQTKEVYQQLLDYLSEQLKDVSNISLWEILDGQTKGIISEQAHAPYEVEQLVTFFEAQTQRGRRLDFKAN